jgi:hypothetical protein
MEYGNVNVKIIVEKISQFLLQNRRLSLRMLVGEVNISKDTVRTIIVEDLRKRIFVRAMFHNLRLQSRMTGELQLAEI